MASRASLLCLCARFLFLASPSVAVPSIHSRDAADTVSPWDSGCLFQGNCSNDAGYWFTQFEDVLDIMQAAYWNGTYWPTTIQWIGAFLDTLLAASDRSFTNALIEYGGQIPDTQSTSDNVKDNIAKYFGQIDAYYDNEDTIQIFGAAYDDAQWVVLEWLEAIKFINSYGGTINPSYQQQDVPKFAHRAHIFYNIVQDQFDTSLCNGGLTWNPALATYKNAITNELFVSSSIGMYLYFPGDNDTDPYPSPNYTAVTNETLPPLATLAAHDLLLLENAKNGWAWLKSQPFRNSQGLVIDGFHLSPNQTTCDQPSDMVYTYNQGVMLSGLRQLWEATGDTTYLDDAYDQIWSTVNATGWFTPPNSTEGDTGAWAGLGRNGIMEEYCDAPANCSQDEQTFKGIFFHHLDAFCEPLPTSTALISGLTFTATAEVADEHRTNCESYTSWVQHNAHAALATKNGSDIVGGWWGAAYVNASASEAHANLAQPAPGPNIWGDAGLLREPPWVCEGRHGCSDSGPHGRYNMQIDEADTRTVQTQGSALGVVKAANDLVLKRTPQYPSS